MDSVLKVGEGSTTFDGSTPWEERVLEKGLVQQYRRVLQEGKGSAVEGQTSFQRREEFSSGRSRGKEDTAAVD